MALTLEEIKQRSIELSLETDLNSIPPARVGDLINGLANLFGLNITVGGSGAQNLSELNDVTIISPKSNDILLIVDGKWTNIQFDAARAGELANWFKLDEAGNIYTDKNFYSTRSVSSLGSGMDEGGSAGIFDRLDAWVSFSAEKNGWVLSAMLGNDLNTRLKSLETDAPYLPLSRLGVSGGAAELDEFGKIPTSQLPGTVHEIIEGYLYENVFYTDLANSEVIPAQSNVIYVDLISRIVYRWSGTQYTEISSTLALGETYATAFSGDKGKIAYEHSFKNNNPHGVTPEQIGLGNVLNVASYSKEECASLFAALNHTHDYLPISGGTVHGDIVFHSILDKLVFANGQYIAEDGEGGLKIVAGALLNIITTNGLKINGRKVWNEDNDGHNSGLDADTLDGKHLVEILSSSYTKSESDTRYVSRNSSGGGGTNDLTVTLYNTPTIYAIGDSAFGGKIAYILQPTDPGYDAAIQKGLVAYPTDLPAARWSNVIETIPVLSDEIGAGKTNSDTIISLSAYQEGLPDGTNYAAKLCEALGEGWFLPSLNELKKFKANKAVIGGFQTEIQGGNADTVTYWSSSYGTGKKAILFDESNTEISSTSNPNYLIRPCKYFTNEIQPIAEGEIMVSAGGKEVKGSGKKLSDLATSGKGIVSIVKTSTEGLVDTYTITYTDNTTSTYTVTNGTVGADGAPGENGLDGTSVPVNWCLFKSGANGIVNPQLFKWITSLQVQSVQLMDNTTDLSIQVGEVTYDKTTLVGVSIPVGTTIKALDITISAGYDNGNAIIIFTQG